MKDGSEKKRRNEKKKKRGGGGGSKVMSRMKLLLIVLTATKYKYTINIYIYIYTYIYMYTNLLMNTIFRWKWWHALIEIIMSTDYYDRSTHSLRPVSLL